MASATAPCASLAFEVTSAAGLCPGSEEPGRAVGPSPGRGRRRPLPPPRPAARGRHRGQRGEPLLRPAAARHHPPQLRRRLGGGRADRDDLPDRLRRRALAARAARRPRRTASARRGDVVCHGGEPRRDRHRAVPHRDLRLLGRRRGDVGGGAGARRLRSLARPGRGAGKSRRHGHERPHPRHPARPHRVGLRGGGLFVAGRLLPCRRGDGDPRRRALAGAAALPGGDRPHLPAGAVVGVPHLPRGTGAPAPLPLRRSLLRRLHGALDEPGVPPLGSARTATGRGRSGCSGSPAWPARRWRRSPAASPTEAGSTP